jgi:hypothetical protein
MQKLPDQPIKRVIYIEKIFKQIAYPDNPRGHRNRTQPPRKNVSRPLRFGIYKKDSCRLTPVS